VPVSSTHLPRPVTKASFEVLRNDNHILGAVLGLAARRRGLCMFPAIQRSARIIHQYCP